MLVNTGKFRRSILKLGLAYSLLGAMSVSGLAMAADWPQKAVTFIVPFAPGGPVDTAARIVTIPFNDDWQYPVVIDNKAGAGVLSVHVSQ